MMRPAHAMTAMIAMLALALAGCGSLDKPALSDNSLDMLKHHRDLTISGSSGCVAGSAEEKTVSKELCSDTGYPKGSLRQYAIIEMEDELDTETLDLLKSRKDLLVCGKTGAIMGSKMQTDPPKKFSCDTGYPEKSLRDELIKKLQLTY